MRGKTAHSADLKQASHRSLQGALQFTQCSGLKKQLCFSDAKNTYAAVKYLAQDEWVAANASALRAAHFVTRADRLIVTCCSLCPII